MFIKIHETLYQQHEAHVSLNANCLMAICRVIALCHYIFCEEDNPSQSFVFMVTRSNIVDIGVICMKWPSTKSANHQTIYIHCIQGQEVIPSNVERWKLSIFSATGTKCLWAYGMVQRPIRQSTVHLWTTTSRKL